MFGLNGTDVNGSDVMYDGNGTDNCFSMEGVTSTFPADRSTFAACSGPNPFSASVQQQMTGFIGEGAVKALEQASASAQGRVHPARGVRVRKGWIAVIAGAALLSAAPVQGATKKTVKLGDNYFTPKTVTVKPGTDGHVALARLRGGRRRP